MEVLFHGDIWQYLETFLVVTAQGRVGCVTGVQPVEARDSAKHPGMHRTAPQQRIILLKMSVVLRSRNPVPTVLFFCPSLPFVPRVGNSVQYRIFIQESDSSLSVLKLTKHFCKQCFGNLDGIRRSVIHSLFLLLD